MYMYDHGAAISHHKILSIYYTGGTECSRAAEGGSFPGNSQIVFSRSSLGRSCATGAFSHCQASNRELPAQKSRHISHQEYWNLRLINVLPFIFHDGAEWNHPFKLEKWKNEQLRQVSVLHCISLIYPLLFTTRHSNTSMTEFHTQ